MWITSHSKAFHLLNPVMIFAQTRDFNANLAAVSFKQEHSEKPQPIYSLINLKLVFKFYYN